MDKKDKASFFAQLDQMAKAKTKSKFDGTGFEALKFALSQNPRFVVKS